MSRSLVLTNSRPPNPNRGLYVLVPHLQVHAETPQAPGGSNADASFGLGLCCYITCSGWRPTEDSNIFVFIRRMKDIALVVSCIYT